VDPLPSPRESVTIRDASVRDAEHVREVERAVIVDGRGVVLGPDQVPELDGLRRQIDDVYRAMSAGDATRFLVAELDGRIVGAAELRQLAPALVHHVGVLSISVHPEYQRRGIGRALMTALVEHAEACGLERLELYVRADNERAHALYRALGFAHEGTRARFVRLPDGRYVDDWIFVRFAQNAQR